MDTYQIQREALIKKMLEAETEEEREALSEELEVGEMMLFLRGW
jgi:hypothetical protein